MNNGQRTDWRERGDGGGGGEAGGGDGGGARGGEETSGKGSVSAEVFVDITEMLGGRYIWVGVRGGI